MSGPANDDLPLHPFILEYRERATHLISVLSQLSRPYLTHLDFLHNSGDLSDQALIFGWNEFIAAHTCQPAAILLAAPEDAAKEIFETALSVLHSQLSSSCASRSLVLRWDVSVSPALIVKQ